MTDRLVAAITDLRAAIVAGNGAVGWPEHLGDVFDWCDANLNGVAVDEEQRNG